MYEMLTGTLPFNATTPEDLARMHVHRKPLPLVEYLPDVPPLLEQIENKILSKEPSARYRTADQLGRVLMRFGTVRAEPPIQLALTPEVANNFEEPPVIARTAPKFAPAPVVEIPQIDFNIDWATTGLWLLMIIAVGGLIPLWIAAYYAWNP
jgi:serine/threonine-protein kinase